MTDLTPLLPRQKAAPLVVPLAGGGSFDLSEEWPGAFTLLVFYRGLHCPICRTQLRELTALLDDFAKRGVSVIAISSDSLERAERAKADWRLGALRVGAELPLPVARRFGLYVSRGGRTTSLGITEPPLFSEPGLFLLRPDGSLYFSVIQTMPFTRPPIREVLETIDYVIAKGYPARGEVDLVDFVQDEVT